MNSRSFYVQTFKACSAVTLALIVQTSRAKALPPDSLWLARYNDCLQRSSRGPEYCRIWAGTTHKKFFRINRIAVVKPGKTVTVSLPTTRFIFAFYTAEKDGVVTFEEIDDKGQVHSPETSNLLHMPGKKMSAWKFTPDITQINVTNPNDRDIEILAYYPD